MIIALFLIASQIASLFICLVETLLQPVYLPASDSAPFPFFTLRYLLHSVFPFFHLGLKYL